MLKGTFVTITGFNHYKDRDPFSIGATFLCCKEPDNAYDSEAIKVLIQGGYTIGYIANSASTKANGTMSAARIYDRVGKYFSIEVCFSTQSKIICEVTCFDVQDKELIDRFSYDECEYDYDDEQDNHYEYQYKGNAF